MYIYCGPAIDEAFSSQSVRKDNNNSNGNVGEPLQVSEKPHFLSLTPLNENRIILKTSYGVLNFTKQLFSCRKFFYNFKFYKFFIQQNLFAIKTNSEGSYVVIFRQSAEI